MYAVITGASRGIGKALAYRFAKAGYDLVLTCEKEIGMLTDVKNDISSKYNKKVIIKKGLLESNEIPDDSYVLVNNAGKAYHTLVQETDIHKYRDLLDTNLDYTYMTTQNYLKKCLKNKQGIILNVSSIFGLIGGSMEVAYSMTKGGLVAFTKALYKEIGSSGFTIYCVCLGAVDTDMVRNNIPKENLPSFVKTLKDGRMFTPEEIADNIYDIVSKKNKENGAIIEINNML
ncbi:MAG: SDR family oxidoreductase [Methanobacteriaceae archaeon]|nr:SDR family oxidoreductase [Methanobacteriaceae archaeon]